MNRKGGVYSEQRQRSSPEEIKPKEPQEEMERVERRMQEVSRGALHKAQKARLRNLNFKFF